MRGVHSMEAREVHLRRRHQGHQAAHQGVGRQREGDSFLGRVLVPPVVQAMQAGLGHRSAGSVPAQALEALSVIAVHRGIRMQRKPGAHRDSPSTW